MKYYFYEACGLKIKSSIPIPDVASTEINLENYDVTIVYDKSACFSDDCIKKYSFSDYTNLCVYENEIRILWDGLVICKVQNGERILINPLTGLEEDFIRFFVFGLGIAILLHQRGMFLLHANAVYFENGGIAFLGPSGIGKSTTSLALNKKGYPLLSDDVLPIFIDEKSFPKIFNGFPRINLWADIIEEVGENPENLPKVHSNFSKRFYNVDQKLFQKPIPLKKVYLMETGDSIQIEDVDPQRSLVELVKNSYFVRVFDNDELSRNLMQCSKIVNTVKIKKLVVKHDFDLSKLTSIIENDMNL